MLQNKSAIATLAVKDIGIARKFYEGALGLKQVDAEGDEVITFQSGLSKINIYRSKYAGTNQGTALTWLVGDDLESIVRNLNEKGVRFEHYDLPEMTRTGDIHVAGTLKVAWFKDPDGNILTVVNGK